MSSLNHIQSQSFNQLVCCCFDKLQPHHRTKKLMSVPVCWAPVHNSAVFRQFYVYRHVSCSPSQLPQSPAPEPFCGDPGLFTPSSTAYQRDKLFIFDFNSWWLIFCLKSFFHHLANICAVQSSVGETTTLCTWESWLLKLPTKIVRWKWG